MRPEPPDDRPLAALDRWLDGLSLPARVLVVLGLAAVLVWAALTSPLWRLRRWRR